MRTLEDYGNRALFGAYKKGYESGKAWKPRSACPYVDRRDIYRNSVTFSRAFIHAWVEGWEDGRKK